MENIYDNQILNIAGSRVFISPKSYLLSNIEYFLSLNGKLFLAWKEPLEDTDLLYQWIKVESTAK